MKHDEGLNYDDMVRMKSNRRNRKSNEKSYEKESKFVSSKANKKKTKKFVFNQNFNFDNLDEYDE